MSDQTTINSPKQHPLWLVFEDKLLEREFRISYEAEIRTPLRLGIIISILSWLSALPLVYMVIPEQMLSLSITTILVICPFFTFIIYATLKERFKGYIHIIGACSNAWAGLYAIYFCDKFAYGPTFTLPVLIFIIFFGSYMVRLRWVAGFIAALTYTVTYHCYIANTEGISENQVLLYAFVSWLTLLFALLAGHAVERNNRVRFVQAKTITEQGEIIKREKEASERLLANLLPPFIAKRLKEDESVIADKYDDASVMFADLVGFTELSAQLPADKIVSLLNKIFSEFDLLTEKFELEKIKTIGDGYMVAGGLTKNRIDHLTRMADLALEMIHFVQTDEELRAMNLKIRIGINSGAVVAGVIGIKKSTYDLWGGTVNIASRLESHGGIEKINVSEVVKLRLEERFEFEKQPLVKVKGFGDMQMYALTKRKM